jgi:acyl carrier protein
MNDEVTPLAERLLSRIRTELLETGPDFGIDSDLFGAGLDSMSIMQLTLLIEEEFATKLPDRLITRDTFSTARQIAGVILAEKGAQPT